MYRGGIISRLTNTIADVRRLLTAKLWQEPTPLEATTWLRDKECFSLRKQHGPGCHSSVTTVGLEEFKSSTQAYFKDEQDMSHAGSSLLYRILLTLGAFPFPPDSDTHITWDSIIISAGMLRQWGQHAMSSPGYAVPRDDNDSQVGRRKRRRGSREQLRLVFQALALASPQNASNQVHYERAAIPAQNEDLLDALAVGMDLGDEYKFTYYPNDFDDVMTSLPSSESARNLDWVVAWEDLEVLLKLMRVAIIQRGSKGSVAPQDEECPAVDSEVGRLMGEFRGHKGAIDEGITWPGFYETMERQNIVSSSEVEYADDVKGRPPRRNGVQDLNIFMLNICESVRCHFQGTRLLRANADPDACYLTQGIYD